MLIKAKFKLKTGARSYVFNPETVLYIDETGVLFAPDVFRLFAEGEYRRVLGLLADMNMEDILVHEG